MAVESKISWTTSTFNPWRGCMKVSPGCANCYAESFSHRNPKTLGVWGSHGTRVLASKAQWNEPLRWNRNHEGMGTHHLVFCASLADVFEDWEGQMTDSQERPLLINPDAHFTKWAIFPQKSKTERGRVGPAVCPMSLNYARERLWELIRATPNLTWQLLTKRPENIAKMMPQEEWPNVWLGTTVENQAHTVRLDILNDVPQKVPVKFCSAEPLLEQIDIGGALGEGLINWVIVGGESGTKSRPFFLTWARDLLTQCHRADIACFIKQTGNNPYHETIDRTPYSLRLVGKGDDPGEWPRWMQVQEFPLV